MLKKPMEEKQLDFNAPLLTVRRFASTTASSEEEEKNVENFPPKIPSLPSYTSDLISGSIRNSGVVPFLWEKIPGRAKDGGRPQSRPLESPPVAPKLPPKRFFDANHQPSEKESENLNGVKHQTSIVVSSHQKASSADDNATRFEKSEEVGMLEKGNSDLEDSDDDAYSDTLDKLSDTKSFFLNCSLSGLSGLESLDGTDVKPSGTFSADLQTRDFMMDRFLPAAKAMASETTKYASRKQHVARERPKQFKNMVGGDRRTSLHQHKLNIVPHYDQDKREEESENEDDDYDDRGNLSAKACGLFPRFCLKNSLCLLNPVPGMKVRTRFPTSSVNKVSTQTKSTYVGPQCETDYEHTWDAVYNHKLVRLEPLEMREDESNLTSESNQLTCWSDSQTPEGSSSHRHSGNGGISPYRNETSQSPFHEGMGFLGVPGGIKNFKPDGFDLYNKGRKNFREILSHPSSKQGSGAGSPLVEKTLYVDSVHLLDTPKSSSSSSDIKGVMDSSGKDFGILVKSRGVEEIPAVESSTQDIKLLNISPEGSITGNVDKLEGLRQHQGLDQDSGSLVCSKVPTNRNLYFDNQQVHNQGDSYFSALQYSLAPPIPKSPSESWLSRTLPSISSRKPSSRSFLGVQLLPRKQDPGTSSIDQKF